MVYAKDGSFVQDSARDMNQSIESIQKRQELIVPVHKPLMHLNLLYGEQESQGRKLLRCQYTQSIRLSRIPDIVRKHLLREDMCHSIDAESEDPVKNLHQKRELMQGYRVVVLSKLGGIWRHNTGSAAGALFGLVFRG